MIIVQFKYMFSSRATTIWKHWEEIGDSFKSCEDAFQQLLIWERKQSERGHEFLFIDSEMFIVDSKNLSIYSQIRFYDTINDKAINPENPWSIGLNETIKCQTIQ